MKCISSFYISESSILILNNIPEYNAIVLNLNRAFVIFKCDSFKLCIAEFIFTCSNFLSDRETDDIARAFSLSSSCNVHSGITGTDNNNSFTKVIAVRVIEVIDTKVDITESLSFNVKRVRFPYTCTYEYRLVAVTEQIINSDCTTDSGVRTNLDTL